MVASLPQDQPYWFDGLEDTQRHDAAFLVHRDITGSCAQIPGIRSHPDICWRLLNHAEDQASTAIASFYAPHVGSSEPERIAFWQRLSESVSEVVDALPGVDIVLMGDSNLWLPGLVEGRGARSADRACVLFLFTTRLFASARYKRSLCNQTYALPGGQGAGGC